jgi:hypothetical protein
LGWPFSLVHCSGRSSLGVAAYTGSQVVSSLCFLFLVGTEPHQSSVFLKNQGNLRTKVVRSFFGFCFFDYESYCTDKPILIGIKLNGNFRVYSLIVNPRKFEKKRPQTVTVPISHFLPGTRKKHELANERQALNERRQKTIR